MLICEKKRCVRAKAFCASLGGFLLVVAFALLLRGVEGHDDVVVTGEPALFVAQTAKKNDSDTALRRRMQEVLSSLPMSFEVNEGQTDGRVRFLARGTGYALFLTNDSAVMAFPHPGGRTETAEIPSAPYALPRVAASAQTVATAQQAEPVLSMRVVGGNTVRVSGQEKKVRRSNYFIGNDPSKWRRKVANYGKVEYQGVYRNVDLIYYGNQKQLEYDFVVRRGGDPGQIELALGSGPDGKGVTPLRVDAEGNLLATLDGADVIFHRPVMYQPATAANARVAVDGKFVLKGNGHVGFEVLPYDRKRELVIDPVLSFSTYLGGSNEDIAYGVTYGVRYGQLIVAGTTRSSDFPTVKPLASYHPGTCGTLPCRDIFVTRFNPMLNEITFSTYIGGSNDDVVYQVTQDPDGDIFLTGYTLSTDFPIAGKPVQRKFGGGSVTGDAFVVEVESAGLAIQYSTYLGGAGDDVGYSIQMDGDANAYVVGATTSTNFPVTTGAYQTKCGVTSTGNCSTAFLTKISQPGLKTGTGLVYSTYLGGSGGLGQAAYGVSLDASNDAYVAGITGTPNFPTTVGAYQTTCGTDTLCNASYDGFVTKVNPTGTGLVYSTFLGGSGYDYLSGIAVDHAGNAYVAGGTTSNDFPVSASAPQRVYGGASAGCVPSGTTICGDVTVSKLNAAGSALDYATYIGGSEDESPGFSMAIDSQGYAIVTGFTDSTNLTQVDPLQTSYGGGTGDAFIARINPPGTAFSYLTYLGGNGWDFGYRAATDPSGNVYIAGGTTSTNLKLTSHATQTECGTDGTCNGGLADAFVVKVVLSADMAVTSTAPATTVSGGTITYQISAKNNGPDTASTVAVSDAIPAGTTFNRINVNAGSCTTPAVGGTGMVTCKISTVSSGSHVAMTLVLNVTAESGSVINDTASVSSATFDPVTTNNSVTLTTSVN
jgi:uncharacterized repeat protein (TIGR01451 family)